MHLFTRKKAIPRNNHVSILLLLLFLSFIDFLLNSYKYTHKDNNGGGLLSRNNNCFFLVPVSGSVYNSGEFFTLSIATQSNVVWMWNKSIPVLRAAYSKKVYLIFKIYFCISKYDSRSLPLICWWASGRRPFTNPIWFSGWFRCVQQYNLQVASLRHCVISLKLSLQFLLKNTDKNKHIIMTF